MYACIDLKSFYASVECVDRGLDSMTTDLVVADKTRGRGALCLAVSPSLKAKGVKNRCRLFEIPRRFSYIIARPRMRRYMEVSAQIVSMYLEKIAPEDLHVYSVDECFLDLSGYYALYHKSPMALADALRSMVYRRTGICATAGVGTNLFLAKIAMDIVAKHTPSFMAFLDEESFRKTMWHHRPITDIWQIGRGTARRLEKYGVFDLYGAAHLPPSVLYREFGKNAKFLIDHAWGRESCTLADIKAYRPKSRSLSTSQVLFSDYNWQDARLVMLEMVDRLLLELVDKHLVTNHIGLYIGYSGHAAGSTGGSRQLSEYTDLPSVVTDAFKRLYAETTRLDAPVRQIGVSLNRVTPASHVLVEGNLFSDERKEEKERRLEQAVLRIQSCHGKNALLRGTSLLKASTARMRNTLIGGHHE